MNRRNSPKYFKELREMREKSNAEYTLTMQKLAQEHRHELDAVFENIRRDNNITSPVEKLDNEHTGNINPTGI